MKRAKLTTSGKVLMFILLIGLIAGVVFTGIKLGFVDLGNTEKVVDIKDVTKDDQEKEIVNSDDEMNISLDEWIGWKSIIDANGGLTTQPGSIYDELGLKLNISIINDATYSSNALIKGDLDGAGYTINRLAFLYDKFNSNGVQIKMPYITNFSTGGDGIISKADIKSVEDLVGKKIGVPRYSEAQTLVWWLLSKSDLSDEQITQIGKDMIMFETPDDAAKAFFAGELDAAATWQPYLSQAQETTGANLLFSTKSANKIILDGVVFRKDYIESNQENVKLFIEGALKASDLYTTEFTPIKDSMSLFATETNENIKAMTGDATLADYSTNVELMNGLAQSVFADMSNIWMAIGEKAYPEAAKDIFDATILTSISDEFQTAVVEKPKFTENQRQQALTLDNAQALLKKSTTINFIPNSANFLNQDEAFKSLDEFVQIAKVLDGAIIQIEGNVADIGGNDPELSKALSMQRAKTVATYLQTQDVDPSRFVIVGNGSSKPIGDNSTEEGKLLNRRTDIFFKVIE